MTTDQQAYNQRIIEEFRGTRDQPDGPMPGRPMLLLTTTGAKSGLARTTPLMYVAVDNKLLLLGSNMGASTQPDWCRNLIAHPQITIEVGKEIYEATATVATGAERSQLWDSVIAQFPFFSEHQAKTDREIPVILIARHAE